MTVKIYSRHSRPPKARLEPSNLLGHAGMQYATQLPQSRIHRKMLLHILQATA
jgi:hypothetical protein